MLVTEAEPACATRCVLQTDFSRHLETGMLGILVLHESTVEEQCQDVAHLMGAASCQLF